ncbi:MAG TPA: DUF6644 family protein [Caulobacteraceae bacterium]|jgi:hypothetical protein|nr:DUF6644 family protein [Caulobacteraceae bacterium]
MLQAAQSLDIAGLAKWVEGTALAQFVARSPWVFPTVETVHVIAIALVLGSIARVDMRLLNLYSSRRPVSEVAGELLPWTWACFAVAAAAGTLMFISAASKYVVDPPFQLKMLLLVAAGVNMLVFHFLTYRKVSEWDRGATPAGAKLAAGLSLALWIAIVVCGRLVSFSTQDQFGPPTASAAPAAGAPAKG